MMKSNKALRFVGRREEERVPRRPVLVHGETRHAGQSNPHYGQTRARLVRALSPSHLKRWPRRGHQQEALARDHKGT